MHHVEILATYHHMLCFLIDLRAPCTFSMVSETHVILCKRHLVREALLYGTPSSLLYFSPSLTKTQGNPTHSDMTTFRHENTHAHDPPVIITPPRMIQVHIGGHPLIPTDSS